MHRAFALYTTTIVLNCAHIIMATRVGHPACIAGALALALASGMWLWRYLVRTLIARGVDQAAQYVASRRAAAAPGSPVPLQPGQHHQTVAPPAGSPQ